MALPSLRSVAHALVAAAALAGATTTLAPRATLAQVAAGARVPLRTPCTSAAPMREALRSPATVEEDLRRLLEMRAARIAATGAAAGAVASGGGGAVATPRAERMELVQIGPRGYLGLRMLEVSDVRESVAGRVVRYCQYPVVLSVAPDSPADRAGLAEGDTLVAYNDRDLVKSGEIELDRILVPGETVRVSLRRDGRSQVLPLVVGRQQMNVVRLRSGDRDELVVLGPAGEMRPSTARVNVAPRRAPAAPIATTGDVRVVVPGAAPEAIPAPLPSYIYFGALGTTPLAGAQFLALDDDWRAALRAAAGAGLVVVRVAPESPAARVGLRVGDVIRMAGGHAVSSPMEFQRALVTARATASDDDRAVQLEVERQGKRRTIALRW